MRITTVRGLALVAGMAATLALGVWADDPPGGQDQFAFSKPTEEHLALKEDEGFWDAVIKTSMPGPDGKTQEMESRGMEFNRMMPGGLWLMSEFRGEFAGQPFFGHGVTGYDPQKEKFVGTWVDSMTPSLMVMEGTYDEASKTTTMYSDTVDEQGKPTRAKITEVEKDEDHRLFTLSMQGPGGKDDWAKVMEISYTRREGPPPPELQKKGGFFKKQFEKGEPPKKKD